MSLLLQYIDPDICKYKLQGGLDETGRGPLFGRVYGAVVIWDNETETNLIKDSKKIKSLRKRLQVYDYIKEVAIDYAFSWVDENVITEKNILNASIMAMHTALDKLYIVPNYLIIDGSKHNFSKYKDRFNKYLNYSTLINGDDRYISIAAASIIAKVERDKYIDEIVDKYDELNIYDLKNNKGYGTQIHIDNIKKYGVSPFHRSTFGICKTAKKNLNFDWG